MGRSVDHAVSAHVARSAYITKDIERAEATKLSLRCRAIFVSMVPFTRFVMYAVVQQHDRVSERSLMVRHLL
jgi:hypothetical protein